MTDAEYDLLLRALREDADEAAWHLGLVQAFITDAEGISDKLDGSWSGRAGIAMRGAAKTARVLYCFRAWDEAKDVIAVRRAADELPALSVLQTRNSSPGLAERYDAFRQAYSEAENRSCHQYIRLLRHEFFAHRIETGDERKKLLEQGLSVSEATYDDLLDLSAATINLVGQLGYLWDRLANPYPERIKHATECCREFWRNVPVLKSVERPHP